MAGGGKDRALAEAERYAALAPVPGTTLVVHVLQQDKRPSEALARARSIAETHPNDYVAAFCLGQTATVSGMALEEGERALRQCLTLSVPPGWPGLASVWLHLGLNAEKRQALPEAEHAFDEALRLDPGSVAAVRGLERVRRGPSLPRKD